MSTLDLTKRKNIKEGLWVEIETEQGFFQGVVVKILSKQGNSSGVKVKLSTGQVGHVKKLLSLNELKKESFKFWNTLLNQKYITALYDTKEKRLVEESRFSRLTQKQDVIGFLFSDVATAKKFIEESTTYQGGRYNIKTLKRNKLIAEQFSMATCFIADNKRKISKESLQQLQYALKI